MTFQEFLGAIAAGMVIGLVGSPALARDAVSSAGFSASSTPSTLAQAADFDYPDADFWAEQCQLLQAAGEYEAALESCDRAISLSPDTDNLALWATRGEALFLQGRYVEALVSYQRVTEMMPEDAQALTRQCAALVQLDQFEAAAEACQSAIAIDENWGSESPAVAWYYLGLALQGQEQFDEALDAFFKAQVFDVTDPRPQAEICVLSADLGVLGRCPLGKAAVAYDQALGADPQNPLLWYRQGLVLEQLGRFHQALVSFQRAVALRPDHILALAHQCAVLNQLEDFEAALSACETALQGTPRWDGLGPAYGWSQTSAAQIGLGEYEAALASAQRAVALNPEYMGGWNNQAVSLWHLGRYPEALRAIEVEPVRLTEEPFIVHSRRQVLMAFNRGLILYELGRYRNAIAAYYQAVNLQQLGQDYLGPRGTFINADLIAQVWMNLAIAQVADGQMAEARVSALTATQQSPTNADSWYTLGLVYLADEQTEKAWQAYQQAARFEPERTDVLLGQGLTLTQAHCSQEAVEVFGAVLNLDPSNLVARQQYRQLLQEQQEQARAALTAANRDGEAAVLPQCTIAL